ncbi:MAG: 50S ribosomal protein L3 [Patescibacteria group bacterium]|nr:50S ribosomal protein L3 [Patescibacteria group bacterium]
MKYIVAKKMEMSQRFREDGTVVPVTLLQAEPCTVTQVKTAETDGYVAVQVGCGRAKHPTKPLQGHLEAVGGNFGLLREFRFKEAGEMQVGAVVSVDQFQPGEFVDVTGESKGKGFQGVVKRHGFAGGPASHGHKDNLRMPGSIGAGGIQRVFKGMKMGGHMGAERVTVRNLQVVEVDATKNILAVKGAVPGARGTVVMVAGGHDKKQSW